jgi:hypothetical protein
MCYAGKKDTSTGVALPAIDTLKKDTNALNQGIKTT